jgi:hypothetical protein
LGWGHTKPSGSRAEALMRLDLPVLTREKCLKDSNYDEEDITDNMVCAGFIEGGKDACIVRVFQSLLLSTQNIS